MTPQEGTPIPRVGAEPKGAVDGGATERHRHKVEVERLRTRLAQLEREKANVDAFAAVAAHELMEPLVMIEVHAAMLATEGELERATAAADGIGRAAARLRRLVEAILNDARAGEEGVTRLPVDLEPVLSDVLLMLRPEIEARAATIEAGPMPTVNGDGVLLGGLFTNLITNALKYGPREHAHIRIAAERDEAGWRLTVEDDGPAIPEGERGRIFEPFRRAHRERRARGTGLGLSICRRIVERHGGSIGLADQPDGNCFYFTLPD